MSQDRPAAETDLSRRKFLVGAATTTVALGSMQAVASAQNADVTDQGATHICDGECGTMTAWRLDPDWGYPRGPHGKTRLESKASRNAAKNRWALTEQDALDMNLHLCSWAPAVPVEVQTCAFMHIWNHNGAGSYEWKNPWNDTKVQIFDERCLPHIDASGELWQQALNPTCAAPKTDDTDTNTGTGTGTDTNTDTGETAGDTTGSGGGQSTRTPASATSTRTFTWSPGPATPRVPQPAASTPRRSTARQGQAQPAGLGTAPSQLAFTGAETSVLAGAGAAMIVVGAAFKQFGDRKNRVAIARAQRKDKS